MDKQTVPLVPSHTPKIKLQTPLKMSNNLKKHKTMLKDLCQTWVIVLMLYVLPHKLTISFKKLKKMSYSKSEQYNKTVPNISIFDSTSEDFPVELNSNILEVNENMSEGKAKSDKVMEPELMKGQENKLVPPAAGTHDFLEY
jgi:hypothetical protein